MKKISLRLLSLCLAAMLCFSLVACDGQVADPTTEGTIPGTTAATTEATTPATSEATTPATTEPAVENYNVIESTNPIKNIILIIGDGMGLNHSETGMYYDGKTYEFTTWPMVRVNTYPLADAEGTLSEDPTDSAASGTAMATGHLTLTAVWAEISTIRICLPLWTWQSLWVRLPALWLPMRSTAQLPVLSPPTPATAITSTRSSPLR